MLRYHTLTERSHWSGLITQRYHPPHAPLLAVRIYLDLFKRDLEAEGLVVIRVEGVLLDCRLLLLQPLSILHQVDLGVRICGVTFEQFAVDSNTVVFTQIS